MKVYKVTLSIIDFDGVGDEIKDVIESTRFPNRCIRPHVIQMESRDIGEWDDDHPLNSRKTSNEYFEKLFSNPKL